MTPLPPAHGDLAAREPVWEALSELFLDIETSLSRRWRVGELAASPYSIEPLERILVEEVHPVCHRNLWAVAGVWEGFDRAWLRTRILARARSPFRVFHGWSLGRFTVRASAEWRATRRELLACRQAAASREV